MTTISQVMNTCLRAGEVMLKNGAETYRVEDTIVRIARSNNISAAQSYVTPTGIFISLFNDDPSTSQTRILRVDSRTIDLNKVAIVNDISRKIATGELTLEKADVQLEAVERAGSLYPVSLFHIAAGVTSGCFAVLFGGTTVDFMPAFVAGLLANIALTIAEKYTGQTRFVAEFVATVIAALMSVLLFKLSIGAHLDFIIIGSLMPLVPGVAVTNAVRDIMAGDLVAGVARGAEATLTALAIAIGVSIILALRL